ncbi:putative cyclin-D6-1 [Rhodamnia argentea]|uniref:Cyclin-D6-1 n=1 Tax=Rhodamnia argentea TaxID=178133 RepID=A0A8B8QIL0_9MYRT|nr:putative cyclin-D6-1 [Rhodamnia argentea]
MEFDLENPLTLCSETLASLFLAEPDHMPGEKYVNGLRDGGSAVAVAVRREIVSSISRLSSNLDPLSSYLAVNYLDRFLSCQSLPHLSPWVLRLLAVCCVSLAAKMRNTDVSLADFQGDGGFVHDSRTIQRMEFLILGALKWRMRSVTPFSFVAFFTSLFKRKDPPLRQALNARATEIIFKSQNDIELMDFRPSVIAASALLSASHELFPLQFSCFRTAIINCSYVNKDELLDCYSAMQDVATEGYESVLDIISRSDTPINVLDQSFSNSEDGDEKATGGGSGGGAISTSTITRTSLRSERRLKRRKVSDHCCDSPHPFQLSQFQQC